MPLHKPNYLYIMKHLVLALSVAGLLACDQSTAQPSAQNQPSKATVQEKPQTNDPVWNIQMQTAIDQSLSTGRPLFLFFTGSDWCGWCKRLQKEVFQTEAFKTWAGNNVILVELDFPRATVQSPEIRQQNQQLQGMFKVQGYPTVHFVNPVKQADGSVNLTPIGQAGYMAGGPDVWIAEANRILGGKK